MISAELLEALAPAVREFCRDPGISQMQSGTYRDWSTLELEGKSADHDSTRSHQRVIWYVLALVGTVELLLAGWLVGALFHQ
jgi:hypothetical protein